MKKKKYIKKTKWEKKAENGTRATHPTAFFSNSYALTSVTFLPSNGLVQLQFPQLFVRST